jgi:hypothetical protein
MDAAQELRTEMGDSVSCRGGTRSYHAKDDLDQPQSRPVSLPPGYANAHSALIGLFPYPDTPCGCSRDSRKRAPADRVRRAAFEFAWAGRVVTLSSPPPPAPESTTCPCDSRHPASDPPRRVACSSDASVRGAFRSARCCKVDSASRRCANVHSLRRGSCCRATGRKSTTRNDDGTTRSARAQPIALKTMNTSEPVAWRPREMTDWFMCGSLPSGHEPRRAFRAGGYSFDLERRRTRSVSAVDPLHVVAPAPWSKRHGMPRAREAASLNRLGAHHLMLAS